MARNILRALGEELRERRTQRGLSQEALAEKADVHRNFVGLLERGQRNVTLLTLGAIAEALRLPVSELVARAEQRMR